MDSAPVGTQDKTMLNRIRGMGVALNIACGCVGATGLTHFSPDDQQASSSIHSSKRMPDGKQWTTTNLNINTDRSYCYEDAELKTSRRLVQP